MNEKYDIMNICINKNLVEHIKRDHQVVKHSSDEEDANYRFPLYGLDFLKNSNKGSSQGTSSPVYNHGFQPLSQPKSNWSGSDRSMFRENLKIDIHIKEEI